jgi:DNA-directed RNA polymerase specialized sigma24 family protein
VRTVILDNANSRRSAAQFATTLWSMVATAAQPGCEGHDEALALLCRTYWTPIYVYIRRRGHKAEDAQDLTQEFFARLLEKEWLAGVEPRATRFRSFLLTAVSRFLANEYDRASTLKRGGGFIPLPLEEAELLLNQHAVAAETPEVAFDRRWALSLLEQALSRLREECDASGKTLQFDQLSPFLSREPAPGEYAAISLKLSVSAGAVGVAVHRLRQRYRECVRNEIARTLSSLRQVDDEMRHVIAALQS